MTLKVSWPKCISCGTTMDVYTCPVCQRFACRACTQLSPDNEHCEHNKPADSDNWFTKARKFYKEHIDESR